MPICTTPVLWWKAENNAVDSIAGLPGAWRGAQQYTTGAVNSAFSFDGASSINVSNNPRFMFTPSGQFSVRCYFKTANWDDTRGLIACGNDGNYWNWYIAVFNQRIIIAVRGLSYSSVNPQPMSFNTWYDLLVTYNNGTWNIYFNSDPTPVYTLTGQTIDYSVIPSPSLNIGAIAAHAGRLTGAIDEVRLYDQVISLDNGDVNKMPTALYDLLKAKPPVAWYPFCEPTHTTGYTPNCSNETDGSTLKLALTNLSTGESCGQGKLVTVDGPAGSVISDTRPELQLKNDITLIIYFKSLDTVSRRFLLLCTNGNPDSNATEANNPNYCIAINNDNHLLCLHESGNGTEAVNTVDTGYIIPSTDTLSRTIVVKRDTLAKTYMASVNGSAFSSGTYQFNPTGGTTCKLNIPLLANFQADGESRNVLIFNSQLSNSEIATILDAGNPAPCWFDYSNWNGVTGSGYVRWVSQERNGLSYFIDPPQRNNAYYTSYVNKPYLMDLIGTDPYFDIIEKVARVDILYQHELSREKKLVTHLGPSLTGTIFWSVYSQTGLWMKIWARITDHEGATTYLYRDDIGTLEDLTF